LLSTKVQKPVWKVVWIRMSPMNWLYMRPLSLSGAGTGRSRYSLYSGTMMIWGGSRLPAVKIIRTIRLKRHL